MTLSIHPLPGRPALLVGAAVALLAGSVQADKVDFEGLETGLVLHSVTTDQGRGPILVHGYNPDFPNQNAAVVFDSAHPTGGDWDLGTPNEDFGGPGKGSGGHQGAAWQNDEALGKILIVDEKLVTDGNGLVVDPDDAANTGGILSFDFGALGGATVESVTYMDVESFQVATAEAFDAGGASLGLFGLPPVGNNGVRTLQLGVSGVWRLEVALGGSAAFGGIDLESPDCDGDGVSDADEIAGGADDWDGDGVPDDCQPGTESFCFGDGSQNGGGDCPCGNDAIPGSGSGCVNSTGAGSVLTASGFPSISNDSLVLDVSGFPVGVPGIFFSGEALSGGTSGVSFNGGLRCVGGPILRIDKVPVGNSGTAAIPFDPGFPISVLIHAQAGDVNYMQFWFRDVNGPCGGIANVSNAVRVVWAP